MKRIIVGVTGASGVVMAKSLLTALKQQDCICHLVVSPGGLMTWKLETEVPVEELYALADYVYGDDDLAADIASGSFSTDGMIILPCSMKTLSAVAHGFASGLVVRAADVCLKENRRLVLCPREMPLGRVHLRNMLTASELGCVIMPPMLTYYNGQESMEQQVDHIVGKILMQFSLEHKSFRPWKGGGIS